MKHLRYSIFASLVLIRAGVVATQAEDGSLTGVTSGRRRIAQTVLRYSSKPEYGSASCMQWTGQTCTEHGEACSGSSGAKCNEGRCFCPLEHCVDDSGKCRPLHSGEKLGRHVLRFVNPYYEAQPFVGLEKDETLMADSRDSQIAASGEPDLATSQWNVIRTRDGSVRLENAGVPGHLLTLYNNPGRRTGGSQSALSLASLNASVKTVSGGLRRTRRRPAVTELHELQDEVEEEEEEEEGAKASQKQKAKIAVAPDVWPALQPLEQSSPALSTFQVLKSSSGLKLWNEAQGLYLSSANRSWWPDSDGLNRGVMECYPGTPWSVGCEGRNVVQFYPPLPTRALTFGTESNEFRTALFKDVIIIGAGLVIVVSCFVFGQASSYRKARDDP